MSDVESWSESKTQAAGLFGLRDYRRSVRAIASNL